ncbi:MAG: hypothetical protein M8357_16315 [Desulfobulbaceae bacterium]|nr:hypothetical protein [Desulfobulbaceae bacterium]
MGWTYTYRGSTPVKEFLNERINCENEHARWKVLDIAIVRMRTAYMAVEIIRRDKETGQLDTTTRKVVAFVFLLDYRPSDPGYDTGYKDMDESMGPCESECPERILNLLSPTDHEYALAWRQRCRDNIARKKAFRLSKDVVIETRPISFQDGRTRTRFKVISCRPLRLLCLETHIICRVSRNMLRNMIKTPATPTV